MGEPFGPQPWSRKKKRRANHIRAIAETGFDAIYLIAVINIGILIIEDVRGTNNTVCLAVWR